MVEEEAVLQAARAVQGDLAEALAQDLDPALELGAVGGADREGDVGAEHRRVRGGLQDRLVLARQLAVFLGLPARAGARALGLLAVGVVDVEDPLSHLAERVAVADPARVQDGVDREAGAFQRRVQQLGGAGELGLVGEGPRAEQRLVGGALLALDRERGRLPGLLAHRLVGEAPEVVAERLVGELAALALEHEGVGLPGGLKARLGDPAAGGAGEQPLQLGGAGAPQARERPEPPVGLLLGVSQGLQLGARDRPRRADARDLLQPPAGAVERPQPPLRRRAQRDRHVGLRQVGLQLREPGSVAAQVAAPALGVGVLGVGSARQLVGVALGRVGAADPPQREVGAGQLGEALEAAQQRPLLRGARQRVGEGPGAVERRGLPAGADQQVRARVAQREAHPRTSSLSPAPSASRVAGRSPRRALPPPAARTRRRSPRLPVRRTRTSAAKPTVPAPRTRARRRRGACSSGATQSEPPEARAAPSGTSARPSERRPGASRRASQERAKRSAPRPSGVAWVARVARAKGTTISRSGQSSSPSASPASQAAASAAAPAASATARPPSAAPASAAPRGDEQEDRGRARAERQHGAQRAPPRRRASAAGSRRAPAAGGPPGGRSAARAGRSAGRSGPAWRCLAQGSTWFPIARAALATWSGLKTSQPTRTAATK